MSENKKTSKQESMKLDSVYLKGNIAEELADDSPYVSDMSYELLKFHGSYQGFDRDTATQLKKAGKEKEWEFMIRAKCPGGRMTAEQYLMLDDTCEKYANGTLRITTRQTFQFHCVVKKNLKKHIKAINDAMLSTLGGCGDVVRNVCSTPAPIADAKHKKLLEDTNLLAAHCAPKTSAYHEIWLDGENVARTPDNDELEPLYGKLYLPRKFKIGLATPEDNSIDVLTNDLAIILVYEGEEFKGYNIYMGGGLGITHNKPETYPRLASPIAFVEPDDLVKATEAVIKLQRDHGDREDRKHARLKYVVEENGLEWTRKTLEEYFGSKMQDPKPVGEFKIVNHLGWHDQKDGKWYLGVPVSSGRIADREGENIRTGLREVIREYDMNLVLTADQNIILCDIEADKKMEITNKLKSYGIKLNEDISNVERNCIACVALPTCGKALAEAERVKIPVVEEFSGLMKKHGVENEKISIRIAGCPNGCPRPYVGDIGIVGRMPGHYAIYMGGDFEGTRLSSKVLDRVPYENLKDLFNELFAWYAAGKKEGEGYGDFVNRVGVNSSIALISDKLGEKFKWAKAA